jgi:hypothetical protein
MIPAVAPPGAFVELRARGAIGWIRADLAGLGLDAFWGALEPLAGAKGRGGIGRLRVGDRELAVRPYRRGGAFGKLLHDRYTHPSRARRELELLEAMRGEGVPVVSPVAALARRGRAFWRLRLCTELLPDAAPLPAFMASNAALRRYAVEAAGIVVRLAFEAGLLHPDLHPDNVLCAPRGDKVRAVLVDLDRARQKKPLVEQDRDAMLVRMQRYVLRHAGDLAAVPSRAETMRFLKALGLSRDARHAAWRTLATKVHSAMTRRRWLHR